MDNSNNIMNTNRRMRRTRGGGTSSRASGNPAEAMSSGPSSAAPAAVASSGNNNNTAAVTRSSSMMEQQQPPGSGDDVMEYYTMQGDSKAALVALERRMQQEDVESTNDDDKGKKQRRTALEYNQVLLNYIAPPRQQQDDAAEQPSRASDLFLTDLERFSDRRLAAAVVSSSSPTREKPNGAWIVAYNRALTLYAAGDLRAAAVIVWKWLQEYLGTNNNNNSLLTVPKSSQVHWVASRLGCLLLECLLQVSAGDTSSSSCTTTPVPRSGLLFLGIPHPPVVDQVLSWLELFDTQTDIQLRFQLALYRSRWDVAQLDAAGKHVDSKVRLARKELKTAMDVLTHKLRPQFDGAGNTTDTGSVVSSANSEENNASTIVSPGQQVVVDPQPPSQQQQSSIVLQKHNQAALNLKANLEQLKGNTKKSLILCSEALAAAAASTHPQDDASSYTVVHANNLGIVYETMNKRHLALHSLGKALTASNALQQQSSSSGNNGHERRLFSPDGTAQPDPTWLVLYNAAICSLLARNWLAAYECMACCVTGSAIFYHRPRCWLRMAEACLGVYSGLKQANKTKKFKSVEVNG